MTNSTIKSRSGKLFNNIININQISNSNYLEFTLIDELFYLEFKVAISNCSILLHQQLIDDAKITQIQFAYIYLFFPLFYY